MSQFHVEPNHGPVSRAANFQPILQGWRTVPSAPFSRP